MLIEFLRHMKDVLTVAPTGARSPDLNPLDSFYDAISSPLFMKH